MIHTQRTVRTMKSTADSNSAGLEREMSPEERCSLNWEQSSVCVGGVLAAQSPVVCAKSDVPCITNGLFSGDLDLDPPH